MSAINPRTREGAVQRGDVAGTGPHARAFDTPVTGDDCWRLRQSQWRPDQAACDETLFALANGSLGVRGGFEESASPTQGSFLAGVWERAPIHYHERHFGFARHTDTRVPVAEATAIRIRLGELPADPTQGEVLAFDRMLDLHEGRLSRHLRWRTAQGHTFELEAERVVPIAHPGLLCIRMRLRSIDYAGPIALESSIFGHQAAAAQGDDPRFGTGSGLALQVQHAAATEAGAWLAQATRESAISVVCLQRHQVSGLVFSSATAERDSVRQVYSGHIGAGESVAIEKFVAYAWSRPQQEISHEELHLRASGSLERAIGAGFDEVVQSQASDFAAFWERAELAIEGDLPSEQALKFNLFHIFQSAGRDGRGGSAAKGLTGEGYEGHVFWDSETFVLPALAFIEPALVKAGLLWRLRTLDRARAHAREMNHAHGALYPWRTIDGDECSAHYPSGSAQYHINAAIAFAIRLYVEASDDRGFLAEGGAEILFETARIWLQVGHFNARRGGAFCINDVTGPDEYTALVDNNYYTNRMAQEHLRYAAGVARELADSSPALFAALQQKLELPEHEIADWSRAADAMYLPYDERLGIVAQDDTFLDKPLWDFAGTPPEQYPLLMHNHPLTLYRHQVCKQADALLALVLAGDNLDRAARRRSFDYYEAITVHDSTLSASTFAVLAAEVGYTEKAHGYFMEGLRVDLDDLHANTSHGAHMAAMAGSWLALAWGFGGLRRHDGLLGFDPVLPSAWRGYRFGVVWKGRCITVAVDAQTARYTLTSGAPLTVLHAGRPLQLVEGATQSLALTDHADTAPAPVAITFPRAIEALIFDLDGVLADTAHLHHAAWKRLAGELGLPWDDDIGERLKGVDRATSLDLVLGEAAGKYSAEQKQQFADRKNGYYREAIGTFSARDLLPGALAALTAARSAGLKIALASASRSAGELVERMGIAEFFDHVVDASTLARAKPDPEIFRRAAAALGVPPARCLGIEDAQAGVAAIKSAGMAALGIGDARVLRDADAVLPDLTSFELGKFLAPA
ncbi:beta-phosphoglucomutase [Rhodanobacter ginsengisoli]|uniref:Beta-phosphoglucomutase n=1 Tax=Rhodanobacter ginsengisoli TaxID=418646 RepID=A0ABW0QQP8_9GAMM